MSSGFSSDRLSLFWRQPAPRDRNHPQPVGGQLSDCVVGVEPTSPQAANTTSGAPLTVSSLPVTEAENDLPERNGR